MHIPRQKFPYYLQTQGGGDGMKRVKDAFDERAAALDGLLGVGA